MHRHVRTSGFTLIELSIVLVIIGLIVGGILVGRDLITAAEMRAQIRQLDGINLAANVFKNKYGGIPGDLLYTKANSMGLTNRQGAGAPGTGGRGNGNEVIESCTPNGLHFGCEASMFWNDLSVAGLIPESFPLNVDGIVGPIAAADLHEYFPRAKVGSGVYLATVQNYNTGGPRYCGRASICLALSSILAVDAASQITATNGFTPIQAYQIDSKIDDGMPLTGVFFSAPNYSNVMFPDDDGNATTCVIDGPDNKRIYNNTTDAASNHVGCMSTMAFY